MELQGIRQDVRPVTGLFFGSFNPIHAGHVGIARYLLEEGLCDEVWFVVSPCNPFKIDHILLPETKRLEIVKAAIREDNRMKVCDIEFTMPKPSYTVDTLRLLLDKYPDRKFVLVIGEDNVSAFPKWKNSSWILENCPVFVYPRLGGQVNLLPGMRLIHAPLFPLSATEIRDMIMAGRDVTGLVPGDALPLVKEFYKKDI